MMLVFALLFVVVVGLVSLEIRRRHMTRWIGTYLSGRPHRRPIRAEEEVHLLLCFADHFEPKAYGASREQGQARVDYWVENYPKQLGHFRDSDGRAPRYSFFFPAEEYEPEYLDALAELCKQGYGEVEVHLHHDNDTAQGFREKIETFKRILIDRHGLLGRDRNTGAERYAFIHGNWALCNSKPDGSCCGVNNEIDILVDTGCFADMTFPSAPDDTQPPVLNRIYYACDIPGQCRSHEVVHPLGQKPDRALMIIEGALVFDWIHRKWGLFPRLENSCLQHSQPPDISRLPNWLRARVQAGRPDWFFVKLHAHGAPEDAHEALLGEPMKRFHEALAEMRRTNPRFHYHYVTAREMYNLARAAEAGFQGPVAEALDYEVISNVGERELVVPSARAAQA